jgi:thiamine-monophosphate kinase
MARPARPAGEFQLIEAFVRALPTAGEGVRLGPGDDAALLEAPRRQQLVATVDAVVAGVHFDRRFTPGDIGWKALAVNLSDLAAMGARPLWALVALIVPPGTAAARLRGVAAGLGGCARRHGLAVVGGNVSRGGQLSLTVTVVGAVPRGEALRRDGARPGDLVLVSGTLGDAALGLLPRAAAALTRRQRRPEPRLALGQALRRIATAAIDLSDGLAQDLGHLCAASGVSATLRLADLPRSRAGRAAAARLADPWGPALSGGEDYELCVTVPPSRRVAAQRAAAGAGVALTVVGEVGRGRGVQVLGPDGRARPAGPGHDHLAPRRRGPPF